MALTTAPTYITYDEFRDYTRVTAQQSLIDSDILPFILHAEYMIDSYIGGVLPYAEDQDLKFPTSDDNGNSYIPEEIQKATIELTSDLILQGEPTTSSANGAIAKESWSSSGYSRELREGSKSIKSELSPLIISLLRYWNGSVASATY